MRVTLRVFEHAFDEFPKDVHTIYGDGKACATRLFELTNREVVIFEFDCEATEFEEKLFQKEWQELASNYTCLLGMSGDFSN